MVVDRHVMRGEDAVRGCSQLSNEFLYFYQSRRSGDRDALQSFFVRLTSLFRHREEKSVDL